ncbi:MAG TPA: hypothetical protein VK576_02980 [Thermoleophilia bacterium]|nr:hypothetical protein [Thermoleophilia bacterium]
MSPSATTPWQEGGRWLAIGVIVVLVVIFGGIAGVFWVAAHRSQMTRELTGEWVAASPSTTRLSIRLEERSDPNGEHSAYGVTARAGGDLLVEGSIDGQTVGGRFTVPRFPPWGSTVHLTLAGERWTLTTDRNTLTLTSDAGRQTTLSAAPAQ